MRVGAQSGRETPASQVRVTPEQLVQALTALETQGQLLETQRQLLETQRQSLAARQANTLSLGQAVQELDLAVTPEQLLDQIHRQEGAAAPASRPPRTRVAVPVIAAMWLLSAGYWTGVWHWTQVRTQGMGDVIGLLDAGAAACAAFLVCTQSRTNRWHGVVQVGIQICALVRMALSG